MVPRGAIQEAVDLMENSERPIFYTGGGVVNSGASEALRAIVKETGFPITSTMMGLGCVPTSDPQWLGMLGLFGNYEANMAMHGCDVMVAIGTRFDERVTGSLDSFSPGSTKIHVDIDPNSINTVVKADIGIVGDAAEVLRLMLTEWRARKGHKKLSRWWTEIAEYQAADSLRYEPSRTVIKPQYALQRLDALTKHLDRYITTDVGQHQCWAAKHLTFDRPHRWHTSGGLGTMGYGIPASLGVQIARPDSLVINVSGDGSFMMNIQEIATAVRYRLPVKQFILHNTYLGMVRQYEDLFYNRQSCTHLDALPDFVKLADAFGCLGIRCEDPNDLDDAITKMLQYNGPVIFDCVVDPNENCYPMIHHGKGHNHMLLSDDT